MFEAPLTAEKLANILSSLRQGLEQLLGDQLEAVYLYGSHARGDARPYTLSSDLLSNDLT